MALPTSTTATFNTVSLDGTVPDEEIFKMIGHAYSTVVAKLRKYAQNELLEMI